MGKYFIEDCMKERTLYYQPYEGEGLAEGYFERPLFGTVMGLVKAEKVIYRGNMAAAYKIDGFQTLEEVLQSGVEEEELLKILITMAETAIKVQGAGVSLECLLLYPNCIFAHNAEKEVFYILHTGRFELQGPDFFSCVTMILGMVQVNSVQYGVDKMIESYLEAQDVPVMADFAQYLKNIHSQLFLTKSYSGQQSLSCRLGDSNIMIDELFSIEAPKFSTVKMMEQEAKKSRAYLVRLRTGEEIEITKAVFTIGKEEDTDYQITDNKAISRKHASIIFREDGYFIKDLDSTNHTFVNRRLIRSPEEIKLETGVNVMLANEMFLYREEESYLENKKTRCP